MLVKYHLIDKVILSRNHSSVFQAGSFPSGAEVHRAAVATSSCALAVEIVVADGASIPAVLAVAHVDLVVGFVDAAAAGAVAHGLLVAVDAVAYAVVHAVVHGAEAAAALGADAAVLVVPVAAAAGVAALDKIVGADVAVDVDAPVVFAVAVVVVVVVVAAAAAAD